MIDKENMPIPENKDTITPEDVLNSVKKAIEDEEWGYAVDALNEFNSKVNEWSVNDKDKVLIKIEEIENLFQSADAPKADKSLIEALLEFAKEAQ